MSYNAGDLKWGEPTLGTPSGEVTWSVDTSTFYDDLNIVGGYNETQMDAALVASFDAWESIAQIDFQRVESGGDVTVVANPLSGAAGTAFYTFDGNPGLSEIFSGEITLNSNRDWTPNGEGAGDDFYAVATHEIGHVIGLGHVEDSSQIMNPVIFASDLGAGDIQGAQYLYGTEGGGTPSDPSPDDPPPSDTGDAVSPPDGDDGGGGAMAMLLGLIAAVFGLLLGGGGGAAVALVAGEVPDDDHDSDQDGHDEHGDEDRDPVGPGTFEHGHEVYLPDLFIVSEQSADDQMPPDWMDEEDHSPWDDGSFPLL